MSESGKRVMILGGYGNAGRLIARYILAETTESEVASVVVAGRDEAKARDEADRLNELLRTHRASARGVDASSQESVERGLADADIVVVASSTTSYVENVARAALDAGVDYLDIQMSFADKIGTLRSLEEEMQKAKCCFITDGGYHPGVPAAMVRYAAASDKFDTLEAAHVYALIQDDWGGRTYSDGTIAEFVAGMSEMQPRLYEDGQWKDKGWTTYRNYDFGGAFGTRPCIAIFMEEFREVPNEIPTMEKTGVYIAGLNWLVDYVVTPFVMVTLWMFGRAAERPMGKLMLWALKSFSQPPYGCALSLDAVGRNSDGSGTKMRMDISHEDGYVITAIPTVACLLQLLKGKRAAGLYFAADFVEPTQFVDDIERMGLNVSIHTESVAPNEQGNGCVRPSSMNRVVYDE